MADRLTANQLDKFARVNPRFKQTTTVTIDNDAIASTDITERVKKLGKLKTTVFNRHPVERGEVEFPVVTLTADNSDGFFDYGGTVLPNGRTDVESTIVRVVITLLALGDTSATTFLDFTGLIKEPEYGSDGEIRLVAEHPLTAVSSRKWNKEDRVGGATGIRAAFS